MKISFLGIGLMGAPMVNNLLNAGFKLSLWNRSLEKMLPYKDRAELHESVTSAIAGADMVITMLETGQVVDSVLYSSQAYKSLKAGTLVIDMSSIPPSLARLHAGKVSEQAALYLDAPVSGGTRGASEATLSIMVGGAHEAFNRAQPVFNALGRATRIGDVGCGQVCKLANQAIVGITIGAVSEALLLASENGADLEAVHQALSGGFAASTILEQHGKRMLTRNFQPGATSRVQLKDLQTILDEARLSNLNLPLAQRTFELYRSLVANGHEAVDHSGLLLELEHINQTTLMHKQK